MTNDLRAKVRARICELVWHEHDEDETFGIAEILMAARNSGAILSFTSDGVCWYQHTARVYFNLSVPWDAPENDKFVRWLAPLVGVDLLQGAEVVK